MKRIYATLLLFCAGIFYFSQNAQAQTTELDFFRQEGIASWYGTEFDGRPTASGELFNSSLLTAAHPTLPFGTMVVVTNRHNNRSVTVRINDRGPFVSARIIDVSRAAAEQLDMLITGTAPVLVESVDRVSLSPAATPVTGIFWTLPPAAAAPAAPVETPAPVAVVQAPVFTPPPVQPYAPVQQTAEPIQAAPVIVDTPPQAVTNALPVYTPQPAPVVAAVPQAAVVQAPPAAAPVVIAEQNRARLMPSITPVPNRTYRLQVGSFRVARNAVNTFERLRDSGLSPAYERNGDYFRVVLAGIPGTDVDLVAQKLWNAGFREALIRAE